LIEEWQRQLLKREQILKMNLLTHVDSISDPKVREFIKEKRKQSSPPKESDKNVLVQRKLVYGPRTPKWNLLRNQRKVAAPVLAKIKAKTAAASKVTKKTIKK
jgi:hypothetical protein